MSKVESLSARLDAIEAKSGLVELSDGTKFKPKSGLRLLRQAVLFEREHGGEPALADFSDDDANLLRKWAKWEPTREYGELALMTANFARRIVAKA